jgi:signal peptidase II
MVRKPPPRAAAAPASRPSLWRWLGLALLVLLLDQASKALILVYYQYGEATALTEWLNIVRAHNRGAAFSFLAGASGWQRWLFVGIGAAATLFMLYLLRAHASQKLFCLALSLLMGGALGNVLDRLVHGYVVDMIDVHHRWLSPFFSGGHFPAFNLADSAITLGVILLLLDELLRVRRSRG